MRALTGGIAAAMGALLLASGVAQAKTFEVTRANDPNPGNCQPRNCSLREAVLAANERPGADKILLPGKRYELTRANPAGDEDAGDFGDLDINNDALALVHPGGGKAKIDGNLLDRVLHVQAGAPTALKKVVVTRGDSDGNDGGGILADAGLRLSKSAVVRNSGDDGAGIDLDGDAKLTMNRSAVSNNEADDLGGGINTSDAGAVIVRSRITGNESFSEGAGLDGAGGGQARIVRSTIQGNRALGDAGGGIEADFSRLVITQSTVSGNRAAGNGGGGIYGTGAGEIVITSSTISDNRATDPAGNGGGIYVDGPTVSITNSTIDGNRANTRGGGIHAQDGADVTLNAVTVTRNVAAADDDFIVLIGGGGLSRISSAGFDVRSSLIALNTVGAPGSSSGNDCAGDTPFGSLGNNLLSTTVAGANCDGFDEATDLVRSNPKIGQLRKNGGPTKTVELKQGSAAIGHAHNPSAPNRDQRGRKRDGNPDSGAFERGA